MMVLREKKGNCSGAMIGVQRKRGSQCLSLRNIFPNKEHSKKGGVDTELTSTMCKDIQENEEQREKENEESELEENAPVFATEEEDPRTPKAQGINDRPWRQHKPPMRYGDFARKSSTSLFYVILLISILDIFTFTFWTILIKYYSRAQ